MRRDLWLTAALLLTACTGAPTIDPGGADAGIAPPEATARIDALRGTRVVWGGLVISGTNLEGASRLEVLAYPLDERQRPQTGSSPLGRFLVRSDGYLELSDYAPGRLVTAVGPLREVREGRVGEAPYRYPLVEAEQLELWPSGSRQSPRPSVHFGIGVIFSR